MYRVIGTPRSRAMRVIWALEEIGAPYELLPVRRARPRRWPAILRARFRRSRWTGRY
jgi:glutathione S-transferase